MFSAISSGSFFTGSGNDTILAWASDSDVGAGAGNDLVSTTVHTDGAMYGGDGVDSLVVTVAGRDMTIDLLQGFFASNQGMSVSDIDGFENATAGAGNDAIIGTLGANRLNGAAGNDVLTGAAGADTLSGGEGADRLIGGLGADLLTGGAGADRFVLTQARDSVGRLGIDTVKGFEQGLDLIDLSAIDAIAGGLVNDAFSLIAGSAFGNHAGELLVKVKANTTTVQGDTDGNGVADFTLVLGGGVTLLAGDFVL